MQCPIEGCKKPSHAKYTWGLYPNGDRNKQIPFCKDCAEKLWNEINPAVKTLLMHYVIEPIEVLEVPPEVLAEIERYKKESLADLHKEYNTFLEKMMSEAAMPPVTEIGKDSGGTVVAKTQEYIKYEDFEKLDLRVATILEAEAVEKADKLVKLKVDAGDTEPRTIVAGIRLAYPPETLVGTQVTIIANLEPRKLRGIESQGMLLAASDESGLALIRPDKPVKAGSKAK